MNLFVLALTFVLQVSAEENKSDVVVARSHFCVVRSTACRYVNYSEGPQKGMQNSCTMEFSYLLRNRLDVFDLKNGKSYETAEEKGIFDGFQNHFYQDTTMSQSDWKARCFTPCQEKQNSVLALYGTCKD